MPKSRHPWVALNAASDTGAGSVVDLEGVSNEFTMNVVVTGSPSSLGVRIEGSHDNTNWFTVLTNVGETTSKVYSTEVTAGELVSSAPDAIYKPHARYVRGNLVTLSGGSSPTVTMTIAVGNVIS